MYCHILWVEDPVDSSLGNIVRQIHCSSSCSLRMTGKFSSKPQTPVKFGKAACLNKCVFSRDTTLEKLDHFNLMFSTEVKQIQIFHFPLIKE